MRMLENLCTFCEVSSIYREKYPAFSKFTQINPC